ncbi:uncharacterized protein LOC121739030 [Aricia agestis]|uniref:uncharacterized protein LOC121739030 n=1 Tax=Aricia agestis TaxID=91739 RepID=UPI001C203A58|nr:uncharacterized protein LOC121739030 [Aricia agestis]
MLIGILRSVRPESSHPAPDRQLDNAPFPKSSAIQQGISSIFSPRMDFDRWKPLTGRGDPLRNDPTYDYEPPVLERVHYWADDTRVEREKHPERKSEVLMLGVSSRKPSIAPRPPAPPRRSPRPPIIQKYEDFTYKLSNDFPMTILVPPPPPPPGHKPTLFIISNENTPTPTTPKYVESTVFTRDATPAVDVITSYALQEANLIYQSSTRQEWLLEPNRTNPFSNVAVTRDYAGWGPTTPFDDISINETHNIIPHYDNVLSQVYKPKYPFQRLQTEPTSPPLVTANSFPSFLPTILPPTTIKPQETWSQTESTTQEVSTETTKTVQETTTEIYRTTPRPTTARPAPKHKPSMIDMLAPMMSMPMVTERPEDNIYAHASNNIQIFKEPSEQDELELEMMQTMQPPPPQVPDSSTQTYNNYPEESHAMTGPTQDPYLHMRFTTPATTTESQETKTTTEKQHLPTYLIIQGHSKVKTYGSKPKPQSTSSNKIPHPNETDEVKHLHPIKEKKKVNKEKSSDREGRSKNLKSLIDRGVGSIEIQEADVGIKYDISDGSDVPVEIYKKGIVDNDENNYVAALKKTAEKRTRRQIDLEQLLPFDEDSLEEFVYNFFEGRQNSTGLVGLIAQTVTNEKVSSVVDNLEDDDSSEEDR